jgi:2-isopropylmalate synthase
MNLIKIFDTTLRDGEQSPGFSMNTVEKVQVAKQLDKLGVDVIEAGFPVTSPDDFEAVSKISKVVVNAEVCALCRAVEKDIQVAFDSVKSAKKPKLHTFLATSPIHMEYKLKKTPEEVLAMAVKGVKFAKSLCDQVVFSPEDATRSDPQFLYTVLREVINAGANVINIPDTVGYFAPEEYGLFIKGIYDNVIKPWNEAHPSEDEIIISTHCQNDLGMATANSLSGVLNGAKEIQCTINGIGERAGNASLEEVVMALKTRSDFYGFDTSINTKELYTSSRLITAITGVPVQPNKAIVGANAFAHESGIHQDGILKNRETYEIMKAEDIGLLENKLVLGKHSGRHALKNRLAELGFVLSETELDEVFVKFKDLADKKKEIFDEDLRLLFSNTELLQEKESFVLKKLEVHSGTQIGGHAVVSIEKTFENSLIVEAEGFGDGPVDAAFGAVNELLQIPNKLLEYSVNAVTSGIDAQATVNVRLEVNGKIYTASAADTDIITASVKSFIKALGLSL